MACAVWQSGNEQARRILFFGGECCRKSEVLDGSPAGLSLIFPLHSFVGL